MPTALLIILLRKISFNSIMVQLEPADAILDRPLFLFQFHKGAIRTVMILVVPIIKFFCFNSIKVQLERLQYLLCSVLH